MVPVLLPLCLPVIAGVLALLLGRWPRAASALGVLGVLAAAAVGLGPAFTVLLGGEGPPPLVLDWMKPIGGAFHLELDPLSAFFLVLILTLTPLAALYGGPYLLSQEPHPDHTGGTGARKYGPSVGPAWFFYNVLTASMVLVCLARNGLLFLAAWEIMSLSSYFLVVHDSDRPGVRAAGWTYLVAAHIGVVFLFALFILLGWPGQSLDFTAYAAQARGPVLAGILFVLALVGFGAKAGLVPLHVWLPEAHPAAPSHVSAILSAVMIKLGVYGLLRTVSLLGPPAGWWGMVLIVVGLTGALLGVSLALYQRDLKRALAYSSIENMGLITLGLGLGLWGWARDLPAVAMLGLAGGLLHVWNHGLMKGLLFLSAGSIAHATGTRDIEKMGGLLRAMPRTGLPMLLGCVAIAGLPPLNGFVSEFLLYLGLFQGGLAGSKAERGGAALAVLLSVGGLALVGALAAVAFVRLAGIVLLGSPRSEASRNAHESPPGMTVPLGFLAVGCVLLALVPGLVLPLLEGPLAVIGRSAGESFTGEVLPQLAGTARLLTTLGMVLAGLWLLVAGLAGVLVLLNQRFGLTRSCTWGCGFLGGTPRIQYTGRSFAEMVAQRLLPRFLRPRTTATPARGLFPQAGSFSASCPEPIGEGVFVPFFRRWADWCVQLWWLQHGKTHYYLLYFLILVVLGLTWVSVRG